MKKGDLKTAVHGRVSDIPKTHIDKVVDEALDIIQEALASGEKVTLTGFGSFEVVPRKARIGRHPRTGEEIRIPASKGVKFKPSKQMKEVVDK